MGCIRLPDFVFGVSDDEGFEDVAMQPSGMGEIPRGPPLDISETGLAKLPVIFFPARSGVF